MEPIKSAAKVQNFETESKSQMNEMQMIRAFLQKSKEPERKSTSKFTVLKPKKFKEDTKRRRVVKKKPELRLFFSSSPELFPQVKAATKNTKKSKFA